MRMIGRITGKLVEKNAPYLLVDVNGVGYELEVPMSTFFSLPELNQAVQLKTHLVIREDAHSLYGFLTEAERELFRSLIKVNGVGARVALGILSGISVHDFALCVQENDLAMLTRLPGIGKKTAERLVIEMRDRLPDSDGVARTVAKSHAAAAPSPREEAVRALIALGFKPSEAGKMADQANFEQASCEEILRAALQATVK